MLLLKLGTTIGVWLTQLILSPRRRNIHYKKKRILARLYGIQEALSNYPSASLLNLENQLHHDLEVVLDQERDLWLLKSRVN